MNQVSKKCLDTAATEFPWLVMRSTWTEEGCIVGRVLDGGVSAVKLTQVSWLGRGGE